jgi:hypothetical protein
VYHGNRHRVAGGIFGTIGKVLGGAVGGLIKGGPLGAISGAIGGATSAGRANAQEEIRNAGSNASGDARRLAIIKAQHAATLARNAPLGGGSVVPFTEASLGPGGGGGGGGGGRRRMRWTNTKALGRAERRIKSAVTHMTRYIKWVHAKKDGHAAPKFHRRKK